MPTLKDPNQTFRDEHEDSFNAKRVVIVGSDPKPMVDAIKSSLSEGLKDLKVEVVSQNRNENVTKIEVPVIVKETVIEKIELPSIVRELEVKVVEVPVIVKEIEIKEVQVPVVTQQIVTVEKPVIVEKLVQQDLGYLKYVLVVQAIGLLIMGLSLVLK